MSTGRHRDKFLNASAIISVDDVARTVAFYVDELGLELEHEMWGDPPEHASLTAGATTLHFEKRSPTKPATAYVTFYVDGVDELFADYRDRGITILSEPEDQPWGGRIFMIDDLNGNMVMFAELTEEHERLVAGG
ncbi:MAG TPA: VOC family protein [Acidimicrobiia bacterium]|nr:VOC family protein [Acidimicrobiia bacterium]